MIINKGADVHVLGIDLEVAPASIAHFTIKYMRLSDNILHLIELSKSNYTV